MQLPADALVARTTALIGMDAPSSTLTEAIATMASSTLDAAAAAKSTASSSPTDESPGECRLTGNFAIVVQIALGALALLSLVYKRWRESPQRPVKIWFFDVSKQVFGSVLVHVANVFMSMLTSGKFDVEPGKKPSRLMLRDEEEYTPNPCSFYLLNLAIDVSALYFPTACSRCLGFRDTNLRFLCNRQPSASRSSLVFLRSLLAWWPTHLSASLANLFNLATMASLLAPGGGSSSRSYTSVASLA